jgi:hypothetical protein
MSLETLLLLAFFILLPLIERLLRAARQPDGGAEGTAGEVPRPSSRPEIRVPMPRRQPPVDAAPPPTAEAAPVSVRAAGQTPPQVALGTPGARRATRRAMLQADLRAPLSLRRAIVLMTILEPCRSLAPHDRGESHDRR